MIYVVCGISGTGKSTIGQLLSKKMHLSFYDADDFHSEANISKMANGVPLEDADRVTWLQTLAKKISDWEARGGAVLACSALKEAHRILLNPSSSSNIRWIALEGDKNLILERIKARKGHFFSAELLDTQIEIYTRPQNALVCDVTLSPEEIISQIMKSISV